MIGQLDSVLVVHQNAAVDRENEYDDWYSNVHIRDVMRLPGALAVRRLKLASQSLRWGGSERRPRHRYCTLYELTDQEQIIEGHLQHARTDRMPISTAGDFSDFYACYFRPCAPTSILPAWEQVMTARFVIEPARTAVFEAWFADEHAAAMRAARGIAGAHLFAKAPRQMSPAPVNDTHFAIYGVLDCERALSSWASIVSECLPEATSRGDPQFRIPFGTATVGAYVPVLPRLTALDVAAAGAEARAAEHAARERLGDRVMSRATATFRRAD